MTSITPKDTTGGTDHDRKTAPPHGCCGGYPAPSLSSFIHSPARARTLALGHTLPPPFHGALLYVTDGIDGHKAEKGAFARYRNPKVLSYKHLE